MKRIETNNAPAAIGPYSQAVVDGGLCFCSGQIALHPQSGEMVGSDVTSQTEQLLHNLSAVLTAAGSSLAQVLKVTVYLTDMNDFGAMNEVYTRFFAHHHPARAAVEVSALPRAALVEMDAIARIGS